ncbi:hypothetical protein E4U58_001293, partial [Claviceps cyperi]
RPKYKNHQPKFAKFSRPISAHLSTVRKKLFALSRGLLPLVGQLNDAESMEIVEIAAWHLLSDMRLLVSDAVSKCGKTIVHEHDTSDLRRPPQTLLPFPDSPLQPHRPKAYHESDSPPRPWLAAVICAAQDVERRMLIRSTRMPSTSQSTTHEL